MTVARLATGRSLPHRGSASSPTLNFRGIHHQRETLSRFAVRKVLKSAPIQGCKCDSRLIRAPASSTSVASAKIHRRVRDIWTSVRTARSERSIDLTVHSYNLDVPARTLRQIQQKRCRTLGSRPIRKCIVSVTIVPGRNSGDHGNCPMPLLQRRMHGPNP